MYSCTINTNSHCVFLSVANTIQFGVVNCIKNHSEGIIRHHHNIYLTYGWSQTGFWQTQLPLLTHNRFRHAQFWGDWSLWRSNSGPLGMSTSSKTTTRASLVLPKIYTHLWMQLDQVLAASEDWTIWGGQLHQNHYEGIIRLRDY